MTRSKQMSKIATPRPASGELSDAALSEASGGAINSYVPAPTQTVGGSISACDGSVRTNGILIGLLKK